MAGHSDKYVYHINDMKIVSSETLEVSADELWKVICEPGNMPEWNPKCTYCDGVGGGELGSQFNATLTLKGKPRNTTGEIIEWEPIEAIKFRYYYQDAVRIASVDEYFLITPKGTNRSILRHEIDLKNSTIPLWAKILFALLGRFGSNRDESDLFKRLESLVKSRRIPG